MQKIDYTIILIYAIIIFFCIYTLTAISGCYTQKKASWQVDKATSKYPALVAEKTRHNFPCITKSVDTLESVKDSLIYIDCPDNSAINTINEGYESNDTIVKINTIYKDKIVRVPVNIPVKTVYITQKIKDSAEIYILNTTINNYKDRVNELDKKNNSKVKFIKWLIIILLISLLGNYLQFKLKK